MPTFSSDPSNRYLPAAPRRWLARLVTAILLLMAGGMSWLVWQASRPWLAEPVPPQVLPRPNAADNYLRAAAMVVDKGVLERAAKKPAAGSPAVTPKQLAAAVEHNRAALVELRRGFAHECVLPRERSFERAHDNDDKLRDLWVLLEADAKVHAAAGDYAGDMDSALDELRLGIDMTRGAPLDGDAEGLRCQERARNGMVRSEGKLSTAESVAALRRLNELLGRQVSLRDVFAEERTWGLAATADAFGRADWSEWLSVHGTLGLGSAGGLALRGRGRVISDLRSLIDRYLALASGPYPDLVAAPRQRGVVAKTFEPMFRGTACAHVLGAVDGELCATTLALWAYAAYHGGYPDRLDQLVPGFLPSLPMDPFTRSAPLSYRHSGETFVAYSVGPDLRDDGGRDVTFGPRSGERWWEFYTEATGDLPCGNGP